MQNIEDVEKRFSEECSNLMQYIIHSIISYCRNNSFCIDGVTDDEETKELLEQYEYNFVDEITEDKNQKIIEKLRKKLLREREKCEKYLEETETMEISPELKGLDIVSEEVGLVSYLSNDSGEEPFAEYYEHLCERSADELKTEIDAIPNSELKYGIFTVKDYEKLLEYCRAYYFNVHIESMVRHEMQLTAYTTVYNVMDYKCPVNIYRQSFILLMTAFDATIVDLAEIVLNNHFFEFCDANESSLKNSYKLKEIVQFGSFKKFKEDVISNILKENYVSGLVRMLYNYNPDYFIDEEGDDIYSYICETIARRNLHIHRRGIVDKDYFVQAQGNAYNLKIGDTAYIKSEYYLRTAIYLTCLVGKICAIESADEDS